MRRYVAPCLLLASCWIGFYLLATSSAEDSSAAKLRIASLGATHAAGEVDVPKVKPLVPESVFPQPNQRREATLSDQQHDEATFAAAAIPPELVELPLSVERAASLEELLETLRAEHRGLREETRGVLLRALKEEMAAGNSSVVAPGQRSNPDPDAFFTGFTPRDGQVHRVPVHVSRHPELEELRQREIEHFQMAGAVLADFLTTSPQGASR